MPAVNRPAGSVDASPRPQVHLRCPRGDDAKAFLAAVAGEPRAPRRLGQPPATRAGFDAYARASARRRAARPRRQHAGVLVVRNDDGALVGVLNFSEIVRGAFQSAYLGYYAFAPHAGRGYMREGAGTRARSTRSAT